MKIKILCILVATLNLVSCAHNKFSEVDKERLPASTFDYSKCYEVICKNQTVITKDDQVGAVVNIYDDTADILIGFNAFPTTVKISDLSPSINSLSGITNKMTAITTNNKYAEIEYIFKNGKVAYRVGNLANIFINDIKDFSKRVKCIKSICERDKIITRDNNEIYIEYMFENGKVMYTMERFANTLVGDLSSLTK